MKVIRRSIITGITHERDMNVTEEQMNAWKSGVLIQHAMPHLSKEEREFIISGTTPEEWEEYFGDLDE